LNEKVKCPEHNIEYTFGYVTGCYSICPACELQEETERLDYEIVDRNIQIDELENAMEVLTAYENPTKSKEIG